MEERLQKVLAHAGVASRRKSEALIRSGLVKVNGQIIRELGLKVNPVVDQILVRDKPVYLEEKVTFLLYKPRGVITSTRDPQGRPVVTERLKDFPYRLFPVGRLDYDTEGLLLLTNDGALAYRIMHPRFELEKVYEAHINGIPHERQLQQLRKGVKLHDGITAPSKVSLLKKDTARQQSVCQITIHEGRNRQVRRMFEAVGFKVLQLKRVQQGFLTLDYLKPGEYRQLTTEEVQKLYRLLGLTFRA